MRRASSVRAASAFLGVVVSVVTLGGCDSPTSTRTGTPEPHEAGGTPVGPVECEARATEPLAVIEGAACPMVVMADGEGGQVRLEDTTKPKSVLGRGELPEACSGGSMCEVEGTTTPSGPMLSVVLRGHASEVPERVWLGLVHESRLAFVDLWDSDPSDLDATREGPTYALEPRICGDRAALVVERRLPPVSGESVPESLSARAGALVWSDEDEWATESIDAPSTACVAVDLPLP